MAEAKVQETKQDTKGGEGDESETEFINDLADEIVVEQKKTTIKWTDIEDTDVFHKNIESNKSKKFNNEVSHLDNQNNNTDTQAQSQNTSNKKYRTNTDGAVVDGIIAGLGLYGADLAIDVLVYNLAVASVATEVAIGAAFGVIGVAAVGGVYGVKKLWNYYKQSKIKKKNKLIEKYNEKIKALLKTVEQARKISVTIKDRTKKLEEQEKKVNNALFKKERGRGHRKVILTIGPTGWGKSVLCNRLLGIKHDIDDINENDPLYKTGESGQVKAQTKDLDKRTRHVQIIVEKKIQKRILKGAFELSVVDSPGQFDTENEDDNAFNLLKAYFNACGGINIFCIVFKYGERINIHYQDLLKLYEKFFGEKFWKYCVFIITYCDRDSNKNIKRLDKGLKKAKDDIKRTLFEISNGLSDGVPIFEIGEENYNNSVKNIILLLNDKKYRRKYVPKNIESPLDKLANSINASVLSLTKILKKQAEMVKELQELKKKIDNYKT